MSILFGATCIIGILCMLVFMFIGIWLFIVALKAYNQFKYKNYILEKINQNLSKLTKNNNNNSNLDSNFFMNDFDIEDDEITNKEENEDELVSSLEDIDNAKE